MNMKWYIWLIIILVVLLSTSVGVRSIYLMNKPKPEDCQGRWEDIQGSCDNKTGMIQQKYKIISQNKNGGLICEAEDGSSRFKKDSSCNISVDCVGQWDDIPNTCDRNTETIKQKYRVITPSQNGGMKCPFETGSIRDSSSIECKKPINCQAKWDLVKDSCDKSTGFMKQIYNVSVDGQYGGLPCEIPHGTIMRDYTCPQCKKAINCLAKWEDIAGSCDNQTGLIKQKYKIEVQDKDGGIPCETDANSLRDSISPDCKKAVDCQGKWNTDINSCDKKTGLVKQSYQVVVPNEAGGKICEFKDGDVKYIEKDTCILDPIDCKAEFTEVDGSCTNGKRQYRVTNIAPNNKTGKTCLQVYKDTYPNLTTEPKVGTIVDKTDSKCNPVDCRATFEDAGFCQYGSKYYKVQSIDTAKNGGKLCRDVYKNEYNNLSSYENELKVGNYASKTDSNCNPVDCQWHWEPLHCSGGGGTRFRYKKVVIDIPNDKGGKWCLRDPNDQNSSVHKDDIGSIPDDPTCPIVY